MHIKAKDHYSIPPSSYGDFLTAEAGKFISISQISLQLGFSLKIRSKS